MMTRLPSPAMVVRVALAVKPRSKTASGGLKSRAMTSATVSLSKESSGVLPTPTLGGSSRASGATPGVGAELGELVHLPELGRLRPLALADWTGLGVEERDQAIGDLFAGEALADLLYHLAADVSLLHSGVAAYGPHLKATLFDRQLVGPAGRRRDLRRGDLRHQPSEPGRLPERRLPAVRGGANQSAPQGRHRRPHPRDRPRGKSSLLPDDRGRT